MADTVRVGVVGSRFAAMLHAESYKRLNHVEMVAVASKDNLEEFADQYHIKDRYEDAEEMFARSDIDLVSICVPNFLHCELIKQAAAGGIKSIICEKPIATTLEDARDMLEVCDKAGVKLMYAEDWCFAPSLIRAKELIDQGGIGDILYVKAKETHNGSHSIFAQNKEYAGGGALLHLGVHPVAWVCWLIGSPVIEVMGQTTGGGQDNFLHEKYSVEDWGVAVLKFANGMRAFCEGNYITVGGMDDSVEIYGTKGVIKVDLTFGSPLRVYSEPGIDYAIEKADMTTGWMQPAVDEFASLGYCGEIAAFVDCVMNDKPVPSGLRGEDGMLGLAVVMAAYESSKTGQVVKMEEFLKQ